MTAIESLLRTSAHVMTTLSINNMKYVIRTIQVLLCLPIAALILVLGFAIMAILLVLALVCYIAMGKSVFENY